MISTRRVEIIVLVVVALILVFFASFSFIQNYQQQAQPIPLLSSFEVESITISNVSGFVYVASTNAEQVQGFQNVTSFGNCNGRGSCIGMIFVFSGDQNLCFWMHNTKIPLEQVWIAGNGTVVAVYQAQPESDASVCHLASFVLETSPTMKIAVGDRLTQQS